MMEQPPFMQSALMPNTSTIYASTLPSFPASSQQQQQSNGSINVIAGGTKRDYDDDGGGHVNGHSFQRPRQLNGAGRQDETPTRDESHARDSSTASPGGEPQKKKQKRNKPTLSCFECVERKTKARLFPFHHL
jgi:hypothetical protein